MAVKVVIIGGGSSYTPEIIEGLIDRQATFPVREIVLVDIEEGREKLEIVGRLAQRMIEKANAEITLSWTLDRRAALVGADFVSTQIRVGGLKARALDERIPLKHGFIGQETNGAGGLFKAFRTIPVLIDLANEVAEICPDAWLVNFTNPAGIVTEAGDTAAALGAVTQDVGALGADLDALQADAVETDAAATDLHKVILELGATIREFRLEPARDTAPRRPAARPAAILSGRDEIVEDGLAEPMTLALAGRAFG